MTEAHKIARDKADLALRMIEAARALLSKACVELSTLEGLCPEWEDVGKQHDQVKSLYHQVHMRINGGGFKLDSDERRRRNLD